MPYYPLCPISLTQALIRCPSVTPLDAGVLSVLENALKPLGFECHRVRFEDVENLYARRGTSSPNFCFAGHVDVVPVGDVAAWKYPPFGAEIHDGVLYGRGAEDMKGAIAAFVAAVAEVDPRGSVSLLITGDEEGVAINGTKKMLGWLKERGEVIDVCVIGEPTNPTTMGEMAKIGRRGSVNSVLTVIGKQGHLAYPDLADNPVPKLVKILHALSTHTLDVGTEFFQPSRLEISTIDVGNPATNVIPASAKAKFNIRFNTQQKSDALIAWIHAECKKVTENYHLETLVSGEAFLSPPGALSALVSDAVQAVTGRVPELSTTGGTSDARYIKDVCPVVEFGTTGVTPHMVDECVRVEDLHTLTRIYGEMLRRYS